MGWNPLEKQVSLGREAGFTPSNIGDVRIPIHWDVSHCGVEQPEKGAQPVFRRVLKSNVVSFNVMGEQNCWVCGFRIVDCCLLDLAVYWQKIEK